MNEKTRAKLQKLLLDKLKEGLHLKHEDSIQPYPLYVYEIENAVDHISPELEYFITDLVNDTARENEDSEKWTMQDALLIAKGCFDYSGGHRGEMLEAFHHGIETVVSALSAAIRAEEAGESDAQVNALRRVGYAACPQSDSAP